MTGAHHLNVGRQLFSTENNMNPGDIHKELEDLSMV